MNNTAVSDTSGALPPVTKSEIDGTDGPTIKISVSYGPSLHEIHLPAQSTFGANEIITPNPEDSTPCRKKNPIWTTEQNLVLLSAWIKYRTSSVVGRNKKGETYWGRIAQYCNEHCSFDPPRDGVACRNHYNYMNKLLGKWIDAYDRAKRLQGSGWSENDILAKAQELYASGKNGHFNLMAEWHALRDQPRYGSQVGGNLGSGSSGSKRSHESDACGMTGANEITPNPEDSTPNRKKNPKWTTEQNLVLLSAWIKYRTNSVVGRNQIGETYWGRIAEYCNENCSFDPPRDEVACRNHYNYMNKILGKWIGAYDRAKSFQGSGLSENDILAKAQELYASGKNGHFNLMAEWHALCNQPRYDSQVGGNTGSGSSGSKRSHETDACGSNSVGSSARPMGREVAKKKGKTKNKEAALEVVNNDWAEFKQFREKELERLDKIVLMQQEANQLMKERIHAKKMKMYIKLSSEEHLDDRKKKLLEKLGQELFGN